MIVFSHLLAHLLSKIQLTTFDDGNLFFSHHRLDSTTDQQSQQVQRRVECTLVDSSYISNVMCIVFVFINYGNVVIAYVQAHSLLLTLGEGGTTQALLGKVTNA